MAFHSLGATTLKGEFKQLSANTTKNSAAKNIRRAESDVDRITLLEQRIIDSYARAVALSTSPQQQEAKTKVSHS